MLSGVWLHLHNVRCITAYLVSESAVGLKLRRVQKLCSAIRHAVERIVEGHDASQSVIHKLDSVPVLWCFSVFSEIGRNGTPLERSDSSEW